MIGVGICRSLLQLRIVYTKVLKETEKSIPVNNKLGNLINTLQQEMEPLDKLKDKSGKYGTPKTCNMPAAKL